MRAMHIDPWHRWAPRLLIPVLVGAALLGACGKKNQYQPPPAPSVTVSKPLLLPVTDYLQATGSVAAFQTVDLVARVEGYLRSVNFTDGSLVKAGQLLFLIEPEPYQAKLAAQQAQLLNAQTEYDRQLRMIKENATAQASVDKWRSQRDQAQAAVTLASINLGYTRITAPFAGRIGRHLVDPGNLVGSVGGPTKLATIEQIDPALAYFSINERDVLRVRAAALAHGTPITGQAPRVPVYRRPADRGRLSARGHAGFCRHRPGHRQRHAAAARGDTQCAARVPARPVRAPAHPAVQAHPAPDGS